MKINTKRGFSLIEIMVGVAIAILIATITYTSLGGSKKRSRDSVRQGDLKNLSLAAQRYFSEHFAFPPAISDLDEYFGTGAPDSAPKDPLTKAAYAYQTGASTDASGVSHKYYCFGAETEASPNDGVPDTDPQCQIGFAPGVNYVIKGP